MRSLSCQPIAIVDIAFPASPVGAPAGAQRVHGAREGQLMARIIVYTGKGGVGKTSVAAATGLLAAERGYRTLVLSTDAAHSLGDSFDRPLGPEPTQLGPNLWGQESEVYPQHRQVLGDDPGVRLERPAVARPRRRDGRGDERPARDGRARQPALDRRAPRPRASSTSSSSTPRRPARRSVSSACPRPASGGSRRSTRSSDGSPSWPARSSAA